MSAAHARAGRLGAYAKWGRTTDRNAATAPGLKAANASWLAKVRDEFPHVDDETAQKMAEARRREHLIRAGQASAAARRRRAAA